LSAVTTIGIQSFHDALATVGVRVWLQGGALLGLVRDGKPIGWDTDVDFGVFDDDWNSIGVRALEDAGFRFTQYHVDDFGHYQSVWMRDGVKYDLFHYHVRGDRCYCVAWGPQGAFKTWWPTFVPQAFTVAGLSVLSPGEPVRYLEQQYGDWRVPKPDWVYWRDPLNLEAI
jgi:hypothetical protein